VGATITAHHLLYNRNAIFTGGIRPHYYCLPVLKRETHREALVKVATSGSPKFFLGTDSAPHAKSTKEAACGCAGCYTAHAGIELYAEAFEQAGALDKLEAFASFNGPDFYRLPRNTDTITLVKEAGGAGRPRLPARRSAGAAARRRDHRLETGLTLIPLPDDAHDPQVPPDPPPAPACRLRVRGRGLHRRRQGPVHLPGARAALVLEQRGGAGRRRVAHAHLHAPPRHQVRCGGQREDGGLRGWQHLWALKQGKNWYLAAPRSASSSAGRTPDEPPALVGTFTRKNDKLEFVPADKPAKPIRPAEE
jgi:hypothetical protein